MLTNKLPQLVIGSPDPILSSRGEWVPRHGYGQLMPLSCHSWEYLLQALSCCNSLGFPTIQTVLGLNEIANCLLLVDKSHLKHEEALPDRVTERHLAIVHK